MGYKVDFHTHTNYSDGTMKPTDLVRMYKEQEYDIISITDHDGVGGLKEAEIAGEALKIQVVPGIELATAYDYKGKEIEFHLLGYYIDPENEGLLDTIADLKKKRNNRNQKLISFLAEKGYELTEEELSEGKPHKYIGKPDFVRAMKKKGYEPDNVWELLDSVKKEMISIEDAIQVIKGAGGLPVLAHPFKTKGLGDKDSAEFWDAINEILKDLKKKGLKGIECYHPSASHEQGNNLAFVAGKLHMHVTEGSDFHGTEEK